MMERERDQHNRRIRIKNKIESNDNGKNGNIQSIKKMKYKLKFLNGQKNKAERTRTHKHIRSEWNGQRKKEEKAKQKKFLLMIDVWCNRHRCIHTICLYDVLC